MAIADVHVNAVCSSHPAQQLKTRRCGPHTARYRRIFPAVSHQLAQLDLLAHTNTQVFILVEFDDPISPR